MQAIKYQRRQVLLAGAAAMLPFASGPVRAQTDAWPAKTVRIVVTNAVGGQLDLIARMVAEPLAREWNQTVVVDARPGANGLIGATVVARAPADGYTLLASNSGFIQSSALNPASGLKSGELLPVCVFNYGPAMFGIDASIPARTLGEFLALARANPKKYTFGSWGTGSSGHFLGEMMNKVAGTDLLHIGYQGEPAVITGLMSGQVSAAFSSAGAQARQLSTGKIRMLAVAHTNRLTSFPDIPTFAEAGVPGVDLPGFNAFFFPAGTPAAIVAKASGAIVRIGKLPDIIAKIQGLGAEPALLGVAESSAFVTSQFDKWGEVVRLTGVKIS